MKLGVITQIRNEVDIIETFLNHIDSLFDFVYLIDHQSIDGTGQILKEAAKSKPLWEYYFLDVKTKVQAAVSNLILQKAFSDGVDYLFFLDADEFIEIKSRQELEKMLFNLGQQFSLGLLRWKNCVSNDFHKNIFTQFSKIWIPSDYSNFSKIVISRNIYEKCNGNLTVSQGHHGAFDSSGKEIPGAPIGTLIHIPIRSIQQAQKKVILTVISYRGFCYRKPGNSYQYYEILEKIADGKLTDNDIRGFAIGYDKPGRENSSVPLKELINYGYKLESMKELGVPFEKRIQIDRNVTEIPFCQLVASALNKLEDQLPLDVQLILENEIIKINSEDIQTSFPDNNFFKKDGKNNSNFVNQ